MWVVEGYPSVEDIDGRPEDEEFQDDDEQHLDDSLFGHARFFAVGLSHGAVGIDPAEGACTSGCVYGAGADHGGGFRH